MAPTSVPSFDKCVLITALLLVGLASAQTRNRIVQRIEDTEPVVVSATHPLARAEFDQGRVERSMKISHAAIVFKLFSAQQVDLDRLLAQQQDRHSANYRKWLTPEQYAARFGMSDNDLAKVSAWLKSQGLTVDGFSRARTSLFFSGSADQVESAFRTQFNRYLVDGEIHFANATEIYLPAALSSTVLGFRGLDDFRPRPRVHVAQPKFTSHVTGNHFVSPSDFATIYNVQPLYNAGLDGTGVKIAVVGQSLIAASNSTTDLDAFRTAAGLPKKDPTFVQVGGGTPKILSSGDQVESILDLEWSGAVARNADIIFVFSSPNGGAFDAITFAIDNNLAPVISSSYGICEAHFGSGLSAFRASVQQGNAQGQTLIGPAGDSGAADCESQTATVAIHGLAVDVPAAIPEVTGIGGSEFTGDAAGAVTGTAPNTNAGATGFWSGTTGGTDTLSSALSYIPETGWNDTTAGSTFSATGGGASTTFTKPTWQVALTPSDGHRDVPDIAMNASPAHDPTMICAQGSCVNGFRDASGNLNVVGGTSVGAPTFAGIVAILNQATQSSAGLGNINPTLYTLAVSTPTAFHDITTGNNIVPCTSGTPTTGPAASRCPMTAPFQIGFSAGTGYDPVTGLGSIDANLLATSWPGFVAIPGFSIGGTPISVSAPGVSGTSTITVTPTNGFNGTVALTCVTSSLPAGVTCASFSPSSEMSGPSTLTINTTAATPIGTSNIIVAGTSGAVSHTTSVSLTVFPAPTPDFTIAATALSPATVPAGGSATSTITVTATNGFTGSVSLSCSSITPAASPAPTCSFAPGSLASGSGTATLTVSTIAPHVLSGTSTLLQRPRGIGWEAASGSALLVGIFLLRVPSRRRRGVAGLGLMLLVFFAAGAGCGGSSSGSSGSGGSSGSSSGGISGAYEFVATSNTGGTPAGTYTITVNATSASPALSHTANVTVTVLSGSGSSQGSTTLIEANLSASGARSSASGPSQVQTASRFNGVWYVNGACASPTPGQNSITGMVNGSSITLTFNEGGNVFTGQGTARGNTVSGTYSGTNPNCSDSGTFTGTKVPNLSGTFSGTLNFPSGADQVTATLTEGSNYSLTVQTTLTGADNGNFTFTGSAVANVMFVSGSINGNSFSLFGYFDSSGIYNGTPNSIAVFNDNLVNGVYTDYGLLVKQ